MLAELATDVDLPALGVNVAGVRVVAQQERRTRQQHHEPDGSRESGSFGEGERHAGGCTGARKGTAQPYTQRSCNAKRNERIGVFGAPAVARAGEAQRGLAVQCRGCARVALVTPRLHLNAFLHETTANPHSRRRGA